MQNKITGHAYNHLKTFMAILDENEPKKVYKQSENVRKRKQLVYTINELTAKALRQEAQVKKTRERLNFFREELLKMEALA